MPHPIQYLHYILHGRKTEKNAILLAFSQSPSFFVGWDWNCIPGRKHSTRNPTQLNSSQTSYCSTRRTVETRKLVAKTVTHRLTTKTKNRYAPVGDKNDKRYTPFGDKHENRYEKYKNRHKRSYEERKSLGFTHRLPFRDTSAYENRYTPFDDTYDKTTTVTHRWVIMNKNQPHIVWRQPPKPLHTAWRQTRQPLWKIWKSLPLKTKNVTGV